MTYSIIGILAALVLLITNQDVLWRHNRRGELDEGANDAGNAVGAGLINGDRSAIDAKSTDSTSDTTSVSWNRDKTLRYYRYFLIGVLCYYITDAAWGILDANRLTAIEFADTTVHFAAMMAAVLMWTRYVVSYLGTKSAFSAALTRTGFVAFAFAVVVIVANFFYPVLFWFDEAGDYHAGAARYVLLAIQIAMFVATSVYTLVMASRTEGTLKRRHLTIGLFGIAMVVFIAIQVFYPLMPFYAMGYMLGTCILHSFVVEDEKDEYHALLERSLAREREQKAQISESREALSEALTAAEEANKAKTAFLSNMSHEIRTPMNAIIGLDNIALADPGIPEATRGYLERIGDSAHHLLEIINEILDMSRIESGRMTIKQEEFSFAKALGQVNVIIGGQCRDKGLNYECHTDDDIHDYYIGDDMKLRQVMINILGNAVKFTPEGGSVSLNVESVAQYDGKSTLRFTISDTGVGMSEEFLPKLFDAFSQENSSNTNTNAYGSTGLGMAITKSIVELMNGTIEVESEKGVGTTFVVTITLLDSARVESEDVGELHPNDLSVLVIDDDPIACEHAQVVLGQLGISCDKALDGAEGVEMAKVRHARRDPYDLILVDWKMPGMDGVETTRQVRTSLGEETPIIILTSYNWDDIMEEATNAGVDTFVAKPLFAGSVMDEFKAAFSRKSLDGGSSEVNLAGKRILLAEDMLVNAEILMMMLATENVDAEHAENGQIAVDMFADHEPGYYDAILMDLRMPEMDGLAATKAIRTMEREDARTIPIIALTANAFDEDVQRSMQAGLNAHLSKPVEADILFGTLRSLIKVDSE